MRVATDETELRQARPRGGWVVVPTMGALHEGHASLIRQAASLARERGGGCVVTIFVNPTQFNDPADYARYPRVLEEDLRVCEGAGASCVFAPAAEVVYPAGRTIAVPPLPEVATRPGLEDAQRPGHFAGVCQVVARLFELVEPGAAVFGEKDWQQLQVVRAMTASLGLPVEIVAGATVREAGGLAMSSRNRFLSEGERKKAMAISRALGKARDAGSPTGGETIMRGVLSEAGISPEYAVVRDAATLMAPRGVECRALIAARVGSVRLIDNAEWTPG